jgi:hypothetical protein
VNNNINVDFVVVIVVVARNFFWSKFGYLRKRKNNFYYFFYLLYPTILLMVHKNFALYSRIEPNDVIVIMPVASLWKIIEKLFST